jgi:nitroreductase
MSLYDMLKQRRMVRHYTGERVSRDVLERIVATVRRAPSAGFSQGQRLLVVDDPSLLAKLGDEDERAGMEPWFATAAAHVLVLTREQDYHDRYTRPDKLADTGGTELEWPVPFWHVDAGAALMLVLLPRSRKASQPAFTGSRSKTSRGSASSCAFPTSSRSSAASRSDTALPTLSGARRRAARRNAAGRSTSSSTGTRGTDAAVMRA